MTRARRHAVLGVGTALLLISVDGLNPSTDLLTRASFATAYAGLVLLSASLLLGPWNVLTNRANPVSTHLRRDVGIWAGGLGVLHALVGLNVHMRGRPWEYFLYSAAEGGGIRGDPFGLANFGGLAAAAILAVLLALSNDLSLRRLGTGRWKGLQRLNYVAFALVIAHGLVYQLVEGRDFGWIATLTAATVLTAAIQIIGFSRVRRHRRA
jgi:sulfoxide reductase heme-binding subunit YedZ